MSVTPILSENAWTKKSPVSWGRTGLKKKADRSGIGARQNNLVDSAYMIGLRSLCLSNLYL